MSSEKRKCEMSDALGCRLSLYWNGNRIKKKNAAGIRLPQYLRQLNHSVKYYCYVLIWEGENHNGINIYWSQVKHLHCFKQTKKSPITLLISCFPLGTDTLVMSVLSVCSLAFIHMYLKNECWKTIKGTPRWGGSLIMFSVSQLQRLPGKSLQDCKNFYKHALWKVLHWAVGVSFLLLNCYLHKVNVSNCSFEDFFFPSIFPHKQEQHSPPPLLKSSWETGRWKHRRQVFLCSSGRPLELSVLPVSCWWSPHNVYILDFAYVRV